MKAAIYIRISTKKQNTDRQYEELKSYIVWDIQL